MRNENIFGDTPDAPPDPLEAKVAELKTKLAMHHAILNLYLTRYPLNDPETGDSLVSFDLDDPNSFLHPKGKKRGRPVLLSDEALLRRRDQMLHWLDMLKNQLEPALNIAKSQEQLKEQLLFHFPNRDGDRTLARLLYQDAGVFWDFLQNRRYTGKPKQIADAMAGVPELSWRRSMDRCTRVAPLSDNEVKPHTQMPVE